VQADVVREAVDGLLADLLIAAAGALLSEWIGLIDLGVVGSLEQVDFIYQVGPFSLILAMLAGAAGMLSLTSAKSAALIGVIISVPAAAFAALAVTTGAWRTAVESTVQLLVNLGGIAFAGVLVLLLRTRREDRNLGCPLTEG